MAAESAIDKLRTKSEEAKAFRAFYRTHVCVNENQNFAAEQPHSSSKVSCVLT